MLKLLLMPFLVIVTALMACSVLTPAPGETPAPTSRPNLTETPASTEAPRERPTSAPMATPTSTPSPQPTVTSGPTPTPAPPRVLAPLAIQDAQGVRSALSQAELDCIGGDPEKLAWTLAGPGTAPREEQAEIINCLEDETLARIFLAGFLPGPEPLSLETSTCVRAAFQAIDPRKVMTAGLEGDPGRAMAGSMAALSVTIACLNDQEWEASAPGMGIKPQERVGMQCLMEELGGPGEMAVVMRGARAGHFTPLPRAAAECGLEIIPEPGTRLFTLQPAPTATTSAPTTAPAPATTLTIVVAEVPEDIPVYDRKDWKHWTDADGDCQDARQEVLIAESLLEVAFETDRECRVAGGRWYGAFTAAYVEDPGNLDIDHLVPLKNAHNSGGWAWDAAKKEKYANHLDDHDHLIAVTAGANRSKGAKGPEEWGPPDLDYWCEYSWDWTEIKARWGLTMTQIEAEIVMDMLHTCDDPPEVEMKRLYRMETKVGEHKPTPEPEGPVYDSCEEANAAGKERVQGSQGNGRGFPKAMVPSARDGDGDGIVCER